MPRTDTKRRAAIGGLLQYWRRERRLSQLALAHTAGVSPRHLCFVETGRAKPSRDMVVLLAHALDVPLRERNTLLLAAGFAPAYPESELDTPEMTAVRRALDAILRQQEPFPAVVMNRRWDIVRTNDAAARFFARMLGPRDDAASNVLRLMFDPELLRPRVRNWEDVAEALVKRVRREAIGGPNDATARALLDEILGYPGVPQRLRELDLGAPLLPIVPVVFASDGATYRFFSTITTFGTPQDVTLQELRIESFFPADAETEALARANSIVA